MRLDQEGFGSLSAVLAIASHRNGRQFLWACCAPLLRLHPQGNVPAWAFAGRTFRRLWGMSVPFSLSAPLLCQIIVAILCGNFEQFANIAVCVYNARATSANCISQICWFLQALINFFLFFHSLFLLFRFVKQLITGNLLEFLHSFTINHSTAAFLLFALIHCPVGLSV